MRFQVGEIEDVRLITTYKGKSKGYAYVQFKDEVRVRKIISILSAPFALMCSVSYVPPHKCIGFGLL